ncbi:MAG: hypothetical protein DMG49_12905 [Acidobacteria bacterium]|nr:MAG: hypothetical protein DMG49_12905 [Acidobacteriota bacterium]
MLPEPTDGLFIVEKGHRNALLFQIRLETRTLDDLNRVLLRGKSVRERIGELHAQLRGCTRRKREVRDKDAATPPAWNPLSQLFAVYSLRARGFRLPAG